MLFFLIVVSLHHLLLITPHPNIVSTNYRMTQVVWNFHKPLNCFKLCNTGSFPNICFTSFLPPWLYMPWALASITIFLQSFLCCANTFQSLTPILLSLIWQKMEGGTEQHLPKTDDWRRVRRWASQDVEMKRKKYVQSWSFRTKTLCSSSAVE